jgi:hypothetical protein
MDNQLPTPGNEPPAWKALQSLTNPYSDQARAHIWDMAIIEAMRTVLAANPQAAQAQPVAQQKLIVREPTPEMVAAAKQWAAKGFDWPAALFRAMWDTAPQATAPVQTDIRKVAEAVLEAAEQECEQEGYRVMEIGPNMAMARAGALTCAERIRNIDIDSVIQSVQK